MRAKDLGKQDEELKLWGDLFIELLECRGLGSEPDEALDNITSIIYEARKVPPKELLDLVRLAKKSRDFVAQYPQFLLDGNSTELSNKILDRIARLQVALN